MPILAYQGWSRYRSMRIIRVRAHRLQEIHLYSNIPKNLSPIVLLAEEASTRKKASEPRERNGRPLNRSSTRVSDQQSATTTEETELISSRSDFDTHDSGSSIATLTDTSRVELVIGRSFSSYTREEQDALLEKIRLCLGLATEIRIVEKREGRSLTLELPSEEAERLLRLVEEGELREFYVESARQLIKRSRTPSIKYLESVDEPNVSFKGQWDAGLQAELDAALADFDESSFNAPSARSGKSAGPRKIDDRGHEGKPGTRTGKVIGQRGKAIFVDLGGKSEGILPVTDFEEGQIPAAGSSIEVVVERFDPEEGVQILRLKGAAIEADWSNLKRGVTVEARGAKVVKGGLEVDVDGIRGFMPISQIDLSRVEDASAYINQKFKAIVTEANSREKNLVISRRELIERERAERRRKPGSRWKKAKFATASFGQSKTSVRLSTSAVSMAFCPSAK